MKKKSLINKILIPLLSISIFSTTLFGTSIPVKADSFKSVTIGADLTAAQKQEMLKYFNVTENDANIITITSQEEYDALGNVASAAQLGNKSISCSYVEPKSSGGLDIKTNNLTWVSEGMIKNALITAGVENAVVIASAPFKVSGTAALTGILKGFEKSSSGETINDDKKEAANQEIVVTGDLGDSIGQDDATNLINEIKKDVIKKNPDSQKEVDKIVDKDLKNYNYNLSEEDVQKIKNLMGKINDLDLNYNSLKDQLNEVSDSLKDKINSDEVKGFFGKIGNFFSNLWDSIVDFFSSDDNSDSSDNDSNNTTDSNKTENNDTNNSSNTNTTEKTTNSNNNK